MKSLSNTSIEEKYQQEIEFQNIRTFILVGAQNKYHKNVSSVSVPCFL
jgi:hypothetical protein